MSHKSHLAFPNDFVEFSCNICSSQFLSICFPLCPWYSWHSSQKPNLHYLQFLHYLITHLHPYRRTGGIQYNLSVSRFLVQWHKDVTLINKTNTQWHKITKTQNHITMTWGHHCHYNKFTWRTVMRVSIASGCFKNASLLGLSEIYPNWKYTGFWIYSE